MLCKEQKTAVSLCNMASVRSNVIYSNAELRIDGHGL
jgi:hypothetical protein